DRLRAKLDAWVARPEQVPERPVGGGRSAVEQPGFGEKEGAGACARHAGAGLIGPPQPGNDRAVQLQVSDDVRIERRHQDQVAPHARSSYGVAAKLDAADPG